MTKECGSGTYLQADQDILFPCFHVKEQLANVSEQLLHLNISALKQNFKNPLRIIFILDLNSRLTKFHLSAIFCSHFKLFRYILSIMNMKPVRAALDGPSCSDRACILKRGKMTFLNVYNSRTENRREVKFGLDIKVQI